MRFIFRYKEIEHLFNALPGFDVSFGLQYQFMYFDGEDYRFWLTPAITYNPGGYSDPGSFGGSAVNYAQKTQKAAKRAKSAIETIERCKTFINAVIGDLAKSYAGFKGMTAAALVDRLAKPGTIEDDAPARGHYLARSPSEN